MAHFSSGVDTVLRSFEVMDPPRLRIRQIKGVSITTGSPRPRFGL